jgi:glucose-6-phosphate 1-dehydrogenase
MIDEPRSDAIVVFGVTGDLVFKQIFPALQGLVRDHDVSVPIIGVARSPWTDSQLIARAKESLEAHGVYDAVAFGRLAGLLRFVQGDYHAPETFAKICEALKGARQPLFYMAIPPSVFPEVTKAIALSVCRQGARVVVEKPFGRDLASARDLNRILHDHFPESAIFRIDHFLGKEPVQNITYTRFATTMLEPLWNREYIRAIQITMAEDFGVFDRGRFYEEAGAIRDVIQNHLLQILAVVTMDPPGGGVPDAYRQEKDRLLKAIPPLTPADVVRGQYSGYRSAAGVAPESQVETYAALKLSIDTWRWAGVPIYIRAGKNLAVTSTEVFVEFKAPPRQTFLEEVARSSSHIRIRISPDIVIAMGLRVKVAGDRMIGRDVELLLTSHVGSATSPYQRLLGDAMEGQHDLFATEAGVEASWRIVDPILGNLTPLRAYEPGTWGPGEADGLIGQDGPWINPAVGR